VHDEHVTDAEHAVIVHRALSGIGFCDEEEQVNEDLIDDGERVVV
jgi:hypothetical protein